MKCAKCEKDAEGWKCAVCAEESENHDPNHKHGEPPSDRHCMPKCKACGKAEVNCPC